MSKDPNIKGYECRRATYVPAPDGKHDMLVIKENIHYHDGRIEPTLRLMEDFKRNFYVTKPGYRLHKDLKEWELKERLDKYTTTQCEMAQRVAMALQQFSSKPNMRQLSDSPYLYGTQIGTPSIIKYKYQKQWPECQSIRATVAALDIETDVIDGTEDIIMITFTFKKDVYLFVVEKWMSSIPNAAEKVEAAFQEHMADSIAKRGLNLHFKLVKSPALCVVGAIDAAHKHQPDFISIWNQNYDVPRMTDALVKEGFDPANIYSDPRVPRKYRFWEYKEGPKTRTKADGTTISLSAADRWHKPRSAASWFFVDSMAVYKTIRIAKGMEPSYALEATLNRNGLPGKIKFKEAEHVSGLVWHKLMQTQFKVMYCVYCIGDGVRLEELDEQTGDLAQSFPILCDVSEYENFKSNPTKIVDDLHFFVEERGRVIASCPQDVTTELDKLVCGMEDWIVTLPAYMMADDGIEILLETNQFNSLVFVHCADIDVATTYPRVEQGLNLSKETTVFEVASIEGLSDEQRRKWGINFLGGEVNAIQLAMIGLDLPSPDQWVEMYLKDHPDAQLVA